MNEVLEHKLEVLPINPGVYKFLDEKGEILYIGKAINLRNRVRSYFNNELYDRPRVRQMIPFVRDLEITETNNEIESLVLESALIKEHQPRFNSDLKDDKSYAWIYVSTKDDFPTVKIVRTLNSKEYAKGELFGPYPSGSAVKRVFSYLRKLYPFCTCKDSSEKECLYFHLGLCPGPYHGHISKEDYRKNINEIIKFLKGRKKGQIQVLEQEMKQYAKVKDFETASLLRDRINDLKYLGEKIEYVYGDSEENYKEKRKNTLLKNFEGLRIELGLNELNRIECYDISNIQGTNAYGSMVVAQDGEIRREEYRIFKIKSLDTPNDPQMLKEVLGRRFSNEEFKILPQIVLIDGGKSQLSVLRSNIPKDILLLGISKGKRFKRRGLRLLDEFWGIYNDEVQRIELSNGSLLIDLRDEAHRFAITHHRKSRIKKGMRSRLEDITGVGVVRRKALLEKFGDIDHIRNASVEELVTVVKNNKLAISILESLNT